MYNNKSDRVVPPYTDEERKVMHDFIDLALNNDASIIVGFKIPRQGNSHLMYGDQRVLAALSKIISKRV